MSIPAEAKIQELVGLCAECRHVRLVRSDRESVFYLCVRSATDPLFPKYPRLPVMTCSGYERVNFNLNASEQKRSSG